MARIGGAGQRGSAARRSGDTAATTIEERKILFHFENCRHSVAPRSRSSPVELLATPTPHDVVQNSEILGFMGSWDSWDPGILEFMGSWNSWDPGIRGILGFVGSWDSWDPGIRGIHVIARSWDPGIHVILGFWDSCDREIVGSWDPGNPQLRVWFAGLMVMGWTGGGGLIPATTPETGRNPAPARPIRKKTKKGPIDAASRQVLTWPTLPALK